MVYTIHRHQKVAWSIDRVFEFFADAGNLDRLTPPWLNFQVRTPQPIAMHAGTRIEYTIRWKGIPLRWLTEIEQWIPDRQFIDVQIRGPYRLWRHVHRFEAMGKETVIEDEVQYALPWGPIGVCAHYLLVERDIRRIFDFRSSKIHELMGS